MKFQRTKDPDRHFRISPFKFLYLAGGIILILALPSAVFTMLEGWSKVFNINCVPALLILLSSWNRFTFQSFHCQQSVLATTSLEIPLQTRWVTLK